MCSQLVKPDLQEPDLRCRQSVPFPDSFSVLEDSVDYNDFFRRYLESNTPCLIRNYKEMKNWQSCIDWVDTTRNAPKLSYFEKIIDINNHLVPVSNCGKRYFNSQEKCNMTFKSFLMEWKLSQANESPNLYYLKDWHFVKEVPDYDAYEIPNYFVSDWLNEYLGDSDANFITEENFRKSDYKFVYIGPQGSWTPFHSDVFGSFSWSANIVGEKEWIFFPPGFEKFLVDASTQELAYNICDIIPSGGDFFKKQSFIHEGNEIIYYKVLQKPNEIIFVPSLWHHQVKNIKGAISINHNWFNATNIKTIWKILNDELEKVKEEIKDCRSTCCNEKEWIDMCQNLLRASHGMNIADFLHICIYIKTKRINALDGLLNESIKLECDVGLNHILYDLKALQSVLIDVEQSLFFYLNNENEKYYKEDIINSISKVLNRY